MTTNIKVKKFADNLVDAWEKMRESDDRKSLAVLAKATEQELKAYPYICPYLDKGDTFNSFLVKVASVVGACYAIHQNHSETLGSMGRSFRMLLTAKDFSPSIEGRIQRLIAADREDLYELLFPMVRLMKSESIPINFKRLLLDVRFWNERTQKDWAIDTYSE